MYSAKGLVQQNYPIMEYELSSPSPEARMHYYLETDNYMSHLNAS